MTRIRRLALRHPATLALAGVLTLLGVVTMPVRMLAEDQFRHAVGTGLGTVERSSWSPFTYSLFSDHPLELGLALLTLVLLVAPAERLMGSWRTVLVALVAPGIGASAGMLLQGADILGLAAWNDGRPVIDPVAPAVGALLAASVFADRLWRRRIRILGMSALLLMILYSGTSVDLFRFLTGVAGLLLGLVLLSSRRPSLSWARSSQHEVRTLLAALVFAAAVAPFAAIASGMSWGPLHPLGLLLQPGPLPGPCSDEVASQACVTGLALARLGGPGPILVSVLPLLVLAVAAYGMLRGRRVAAWLAVALNVGQSALAAFYYVVLPAIPDGDQLRLPDPAGAAVPIALAVLLPLGLALRIALSVPHFTVRPSRTGLARYLTAIGAAWGAAALVYVGGGFLVRDQFEPPVTFVGLLLDLPERFVPVGYLALRELQFVPSGLAAQLLYSWVGPAVWAVVLLSTAVVIYEAAGRAKANDLERIRAMLRQEGCGSLSYMATWQGNDYWFTEDGELAVAYRVVSDVALTMGPPIGPRERRVEAALDFAAFCGDHGWIPAFYSVGDKLCAGLQERGWHATEIGDDAVLDPASFGMSGKRWQDVRTSINRARKLGITDEWTSWEQLGLAARSQIEVISEDWVGARNLPEMGFTLGGIDELQDPEVRLLLAVGPDGRIEAVTSWLPTYSEGEVIGWTLDVMRRRAGSMNGVVEFLIARMMQRAQDRGLAFVSLSAAPLSRAGHPAGDLAGSVLGFLGRRLEALYGFRSLLAFKLKFQPEFRALHLTFPDAVMLPAIAMAIARAYLPGLTVPQAVSLTRSLVFASDTSRTNGPKVPTA